MTHNARFECLRGALYLLLHFTQVDRARLERLGVLAIIVSGHSTLIDDYDPDTLAPLVEVIPETRTPLLGLCGSHRLIGLAFGERHPDGRIILSNFFRLAGLAVPRSEAAALARA